MLLELLEDLDESNELSPLQKKYQNYFNCWLKQYKVTSPADFTNDILMKEFFNKVKTYWKTGVGPIKSGDGIVNPCEKA